MPRANTGRAAKNPRTLGSAAAFAGCIGLPEPGISHRGAGSLEDWCRTVFNPTADAWLRGQSIESRAFVRAEREARCT